MNFISENIGTIAVLVILAVLIYFSSRKIGKNKASGKICSCCGGCNNCRKK